MKEEKNTEEDLNQIEDLQNQLRLANQEIKVYQEMQKLENEETFRYNLLAILQEQNQIQKLNGQVMINIGKLLQSQIEETSEGEEEVEAEEVPVLTKEQILEAKIKQLESERDKIKPELKAKPKEVPKKKGFFGKLKQVGEGLEKDMNSIP